MAEEYFFEIPMSELFEDKNILPVIKNIFKNYEEYSFNAKKYIDLNHSVKYAFDKIKNI